MLPRTFSVGYFAYAQYDVLFLLVILNGSEESHRKGTEHILCGNSPSREFAAVATLLRNDDKIACHRERKRGDPPELLHCRLFGGIAAVAMLPRNDNKILALVYCETFHLRKNGANAFIIPRTASRKTRLRVLFRPFYRSCRPLSIRLCRITPLHIACRA